MAFFRINSPFPVETSYQQILTCHRDISLSTPDHFSYKCMRQKYVATGRSSFVDNCSPCQKHRDKQSTKTCTHNEGKEAQLSDVGKNNTALSRLPRQTYNIQQFPNKIAYLINVSLPIFMPEKRRIDSRQVGWILWKMARALAIVC